MFTETPDGAGGVFIRLGTLDVEMLVRKELEDDCRSGEGGVSEKG